MANLVNLKSVLVVVLFCLLAQFCSTQIITTPRKCGVNEQYLSCGGSCQTKCATLNQPCLIRHIRCPDGCYCLEGFARNAAGTCIPIRDCDK